MELRKTSLHSRHLKLNAKMVPFAEFDMPLQYSTAKQEVFAVRNNCGMFDVSHMGEFFVEGPDAEKFIDHIITNDFINAGPLKAVYSPICREDGTIVDDAISYKVDNNKVLICVNAANTQKDWDWLNSHINNFNCSLTDRSAEYSLIAVQGPETEEIFKQLELLPNDDFSYYSVKTIQRAQSEIIISRTGYTGEDGFEVFCDHNMAQTLWDKLLEKKVTPCGLVSRDILRLEVCFPLYGNELKNNLTPLDSGLKWTLKFNKPNFIGKAYLENYKPQYRLIKLSIEKGIPREGYEISNSDDIIIGHIASGTMSLTQSKGIATALIKKDQFPKNKIFFIKIREKQIQAFYHTKPFVIGGHK